MAANGRCPGSRPGPRDDADPYLGCFLGPGQAILSGAVGRIPGNMTEWDATKGIWHLSGVAALAYGLTALPGGPVTGTRAMLALQTLMSNETADDVADALVGEKDSLVAARKRASRSRFQGPFDTAGG